LPNKLWPKTKWVIRWKEDPEEPGEWGRVWEERAEAPVPASARAGIKPRPYGGGGESGGTGEAGTRAKEGVCQGSGSLSRTGAQRDDPRQGRGIDGTRRTERLIIRITEKRKPCQRSIRKHFMHYFLKLRN
jgi:hypothetical protein